MNTLMVAALCSSADAGVAQLLLGADVEPRERQERPIIPAIRFVLSDMADANCIKGFIFDRTVILQLAELFALPEYVIPARRDKLHRSEALCILLYRTSYPRRN
ncbi:hypothetical protein PC129_g2727 [Phytophthora cactorum]|uniref:Uncharacterized protein n=2 Tax=Phytophthora cactorum TaxID=29920 RepID=A0A8T1INV6_9STRA|nr:hypothetical protein Pcac1_g19433 [Phytophthora cactorum]KAG2843981.1 hypothetical protein PC112_g2432 [Phytophthora cactorum]KAG2935810.1 hypothetical protein PC114_g408 [Phytophthora cactorum]KAG2940365.1 hypothetical protein PC115_g2638 [Phytophthora cactorum]KAG2950431.1 hypothetical protein PC117_g4409 [Phytophthora cactorum]